MATFRYRDEERTSSGILYMAAGALAGVAAGVLIAQRFGGLSGVTARVRDRFAAAGRGGDVEPSARYSAERESLDDDDTLSAVRDYDEGAYAGEEAEGDDYVLEDRVLTAFRNDPILSERAVDIGAIGEGIIELTGWVHSDEEAEHAMTLTRGVPGVDTVVNRLAVRDAENNFRSARRRYARGDDALTEARWEGQQVGIGRPRQGSSDDPDRHADPKAELEDRWLGEQQSVEAAAEDMSGIAERRKSGKKQPKGDRTGGAPVAPSGVPKADHVAGAPPAAEEPGRDSTYRAD